MKIGKKMQGDSLLFWKIILWVAPVIFIVIGGIISFYANLKIHSIESTIRLNVEKKQESFKNSTMKNQSELLDYSKLTVQKTDSISLSINNNAEITKQIILKNEEVFELTQKPEILIIQDNMFKRGKNNHYNITIKNFGNSTASEVMLFVNYLVPKGMEFIKKIKELPKNEKITFQVEMVPDFAILPLNKNWNLERQDYINKFNNGDIKIIFDTHLEYMWNGKIYKSKNYTFIHYE